MTRLEWRLPGQRFFEAGVDRGVLYPPNGAVGVPWNGLISISENPSGGEPKPLYLDGVKYLNVSAAEEFAFSIEAFSAPREFAACDGSNMMAAGLFISNQPRKSFDFTYRTLIGNEIEGLDLGYKIHLIYDALAGPSERTNRSISDRTQPLAFKWDATTRPRAVPGIRPTAHLVVDSRRTTSAILTALERELYGTDEIEPHMPTPAELIAIFSITATGYGYGYGPYGHGPYGHGP